MQTSGGAVSGFIQRYMNVNAACSWAQLKQQLAVRFSDVTDPQMALSMLRRVKQKQGETIHNYSDRILTLAEDAYGNQGGNAAERNLIDIFVDGLLNDHLKMKILRDQPITLQAAIAVAVNEKNLRNRVKIASGASQYEPMEVDLSRGQRFKKRINDIKCWNCGKTGHVIKDCKEKSSSKPPMGHGRPINLENW